MVPRCACSKWPVRGLVAPVKAPFACPNNSASTRFSGIAAQLTATISESARGLAVWSARATISLPVPVSPVINAVVCRGPIKRMSA